VRTLLYDNFDVHIESSGDTFRAMVVNSPDGETRTVPFVPPVSPERLELLVLKMRTAPGMRAMQTDAAPDTRQLGATLFDALFHDDVLDRLRRSLSRTEARGRGLRIRLRFSDAHELWNMPWELLYDSEEHRFLCQFDTTPVVRYVDMAQPVEPLTVSGPIRMLVMISSPTDYPPLDVDKEWAQLSEALHPLEAAGGLLVQRLPSGSLEDLRRTMMFGEFHVFHYIGHGGLDQHTGDGLLVLTGPDGRSRLATGAELYVMLANSPVRLAVLNSCQGARIGAADPYAGAAASLVHQGIPAVVAMQFEISDDAAIAFSRTLYEAIAYGWPVDTAVAEARRAILAASRAEWATPVLYLRAADGVLLNTPAPSRTPAPAQPTGLTGSVTDGVVTLQWAPTSAGLTEVARWEVRRDGTAVREATEPHATDQPTQPGSHQYTVLAIGTDGQHSTESAPWTAVLPSTPKAPPDRAGEPEPPVRRRRRRLVYAAAAALVLAAAGTAATLLILDRGDSPGEAGRPASNEITAAAAWRLVISNKIDGANGCTVTVTNTDTGDQKVFENIWGTKTFQMQTAGKFRWEANDSGCLVVQHSGSGKAVLPFSQKADTGDTDVFAAPKAPGKVAVQVLAFNSYGECDFELHDAADGQLVDLGTVPQGKGPLRLEPNGRSQVYLADFAGCDVRVSAEP